MNQTIGRSLAAIACVYAVLIPQAANAGWLGDRIQERVDDWNNSPSNVPTPQSDTQLNPINRDGFGYIDQLGNSTDENGNYRQPVRTEDAFGSKLKDGVYVAPTTWDVDLGIQYEVQDGEITNQRYRHTRGNF